MRGLALSETSTVSSVEPSSESKGFTLIELLIVIAVLGVLAAGVLVAINPGEQLARGRDASRKTSVGQLNKAAQAYYTSRGRYMGGWNWITALVNAGEIKSVPTQATFTGQCVPTSFDMDRGIYGQNGFCYRTSLREAVIFTRMESSSEDAKCPTPDTQSAYFLWSSADGRAGTVCIDDSNVTTAPYPLGSLVVGAYTYVN